MADEECLGAMWQINKLVGNISNPAFIPNNWSLWSYILVVDLSYILVVSCIITQ